MTTYIAAIRTLVFFVLVALFVRAGTGAQVVIYIEMVAEGVSVLFGLSALRMGRPAESSRSELAPHFGILHLLTFSMPFLLIAVLNNVQTVMDIVLLRFLRGSEVVAHYDIGIKIGFFYFFIGATLIQIIRPKLTRLYQEHAHARMGSILKMSSAFLLLFSVLLLIPSFYFAAPLTALLFNSEEPLTVFIFQWASIWVTTSFMTMLVADTLLSLGRRRHYVYGALACAAVNIVLNLALIRLFSGHGAIFAKILSEAVFLGVALYFIPHAVRSTFSTSLVFQFLVLAGFVAVHIASTAAGQPMAGFVLSLIGCGLIVWRGRVFSRDTLAVLRDN